MVSPPIQIIIAVITSTGLFTFIQFLIIRHDKKKNNICGLQASVQKLEKAIQDVTKELDEAREDTLTMLHDRLYQMYDYLEVKQEISLEQKTNWDYLFKRYSDRGGNHKAFLMDDVVKQIPVKKSTEDKNNGQ